MKIKFLNSDKQFETDQSEISLLEICKKIGAPVNFGCRVGICGTCKISIVGDLMHVSEKNEAEKEFTSEPDERLACQCIVKGDISVNQSKRSN